MPTAVITQTKTGSANFYAPSAEYNAHVEDTYISTGRLVVTKITNSQNNVEVVLTFTTEDDRVAFLTDPIVVAHLEASRAYNESASIVSNTEVTE
jgi:hypothetical protein